MPAAQPLLFPDPRPLVERFGRSFFRQLPEAPGVYLMRDASDTVLYIGKAGNLRKRLGSYRVANPDRLPRRHLRLLWRVARIELQECPTEPAARAREAELLSTLRPKFNRAGTWRPPVRLLGFRATGQSIHLAVKAAPDPEWPGQRPVRGAASRTHAALARLLRIAVDPDPGFGALPVGWMEDRVEPETVIECGDIASMAAGQLEQLWRGGAERFSEWILGRLPGDLHPFEATWIDADLRQITRVFQEDGRTGEGAVQRRPGLSGCCQGTVPPR